MAIRNLPELEEYRDRYSSLETRSLTVTLRTLQPVVATHPLHLDGLLAWAVFKEATQRPIPQSSDLFYIPLPLGLERLHDNLPLWQCSNLVGVDESIDHTHYHQRSDCNPYDLPATISKLSNKKKRRMPSTREGQYMSYRVPVRRVVCDRWEASCMGNQIEILRLLESVTHVGKKGSQGYGRVLGWEVEESNRFEWGDRPVPVQSAEDILRSGEVFMCGWTPPYWHRGAWSMCSKAE